MRKLLLISMAMLLASCIHAQTLHAIIFANTECPGNPRNPKDRGIGHSVSGDYYRMKIEMTTIASFIGYKLKDYYCIGSQQQFCREKLDNVIDGLSCGPQDIVFFYYSGHGSRSVNEKTPFPQMNLIVDPYRNSLPEAVANYPLYNVMTRIKAKSPRLTIVVGDMCNSIAEWVTAKSLPNDKTATKVEEVPVKFYKDLFLKVKGSIIAASSKPGQTSAAYEEGGAFTLGLMQAMQAMIADGTEPTWNMLLENSIQATEQMTGGRQTPIYDTSDIYDVTENNSTQINNPSAAVAESTDNVVDEEVETASPSITHDEDALATLLTCIGSESMEIEKRIDWASKALSLLFDSPDAVVNVVGRDGKTVVSVKTAKAYLDWLTVTANLYKVIPIKAKLTENDKFTFLQIHEMYK